LTRPDRQKPAQVVAWLGAMQAQDFPAAKWAVGLRSPGCNSHDIEEAFNDGAILRTHVLRPTWHFVTPADIRWMLALTAPRVGAAMASYNRKLELTPRVFSRSHTLVARALEGGRFLTRAELGAALARRGIEAQGQRLAHLMMQAELDQVICSGPRRGKQFTYALLAERAPRAKALTREESLAELTRRYFASHGPATVKDFSWWSGLTTKEARLGVELCQPGLVREVTGELTYWSSPGDSEAPAPARAAHVLPIYDEFLIAYKDRGHVAGEGGARDALTAAAAGFPHLLIIGGRLTGSWKRTPGRDALIVTVAPYRSLSGAEIRQVKLAADRFGTFQGVPVVTTFTS
jgi:hypothetical protein